jgi:hypothetical protein
MISEKLVLDPENLDPENLDPENIVLTPRFRRVGRVAAQQILPRCSRNELPANYSLT